MGENGRMTSPESPAVPVSHAGSLPRTPELLAANAARRAGEEGDYDAILTRAVADVVRAQLDAGVTIVGDGEYGKSMSNPFDFGAWWTYSFTRLGGLEIDPAQGWVLDRHLSEPGRIQLTGFGYRRDHQAFADAYEDPGSGVFLGDAPSAFPTVTGPLEYIGQDAVARDVANLTDAMTAAGAGAGFITALSPGSATRIGNRYYKTDEEFLYAAADALRQEYLAITDAGLTVQIDDPSFAENFDQIEPEPSVEDYVAFTRIRVEALNYALRGIPEEQVRFHLCWGSWHGPHTTDIEFRHIARLLLEVNAGSYSFEAANARHEHEWTVWQDLALPDGKTIVPGLVGHSTNVVEHPELVAQRLRNFVNLVGAGNVVASTDCGLGGRIHPHIAWAKLAALSAGTALVNGGTASA